MSIVTNTEQLQIDSTCILDHFLIQPAMLFYILFFYSAIRNMRILRVNINVIEKIHPHKAMIALQGIIANRVVFIKIKTDHIFKAELFFFVHTYQLSVYSFRSRTGGKPKYNLLFSLLLFTDEFSDLFGNCYRTGFKIWINFYRDPFK